jgi:hypothetical protein
VNPHRHACRVSIHRLLARATETRVGAHDATDPRQEEAYLHACRDVAVPRGGKA